MGAVRPAVNAFLSEEAVEEAFAGEIGRILFKKPESSSMAGVAYWSRLRGADQQKILGQAPQSLRIAVKEAIDET